MLPLFAPFLAAVLAGAPLAVVQGAGPAVPRQEALEIGTGSLLEEMADLARLARLPDPPYRTVQFSSYDRPWYRSLFPPGAGSFFGRAAPATPSAST